MKKRLLDGDDLDEADNWFNFYFAAEEVEERLSVSGGVARRMLRGACASGDIRSVRQLYDPRDSSAEEMPEPVPPGDWKREEVDHATFGEYVYIVDLNKDDFAYWLDKQAAPAAEPRTAHKRDLAGQAVADLWANGVPKELLNKRIEELVADWLKAKGLPEISRDTILRAAGRK